MLAIIDSGVVREGPLTQWGREELLLWRAAGQPADAFSLCVRQVYAIDPPLRVAAGVRVSSVQWVPLSKLEFTGARFRPVACPASPGEFGADLAARIGLSSQWDTFNEFSVCCQLPAPVFALVKKNLHGRTCCGEHRR